jgi:PAS domain S-box-containing protein
MEEVFDDTTSMFRLLFERSADAMTLQDPLTGVFLDVNDASVRITGAPDKAALLNSNPLIISPERQPDGVLSSEKVKEVIQLAVERGSHRFEWVINRFDGTQLPVEIVLTLIRGGERPMLLSVARDITERKHTESESLKLNASLEHGIAERTAELTASEARLRTILEHAPEAVVVFDGETGRFLTANRHALELYGCTAEELPSLGPADVSPEFQPDGRRSAEAARDWINQASAGKTPMFEWLHQHRSGRIIPTEVRLVRLPGEGRTLLRASILDNTEHKRTEETLRLRGEQIQKHRNVLLHLARFDKSDFDQALRTITSLAASTMNIARVSYWSIQDDDAALVCELLHLNSTASVDESFKGTRLNLASAPAYFAALELKCPVVAHDVRAQPATAGLVDEYLMPLGITSLLDVPVWVRGEVVGVLCHEHVGPAREWSAEEIDFASSLAAMLSLAIEESQRARSEQLLRKSEEKFKALFALSPLGMARVSWDGRFLQVNESFASIIGRQPEEVLTLSYWDVTPRDYEAQELAVLDTIRKTGRFGPFEKEYLHSDGHRVPILISGMLVKSAPGADEIWGIIQDITQRKQAEQALRDSEEKFRALFETSSQGVMLHDEEKYLEVNPAIVQILGYDSPADLIGLSPVVTSPPIQPDGQATAVLAQRYIQECLTRGHVRFDWMARRKSGEDIPVEVILTRIRWGGKQIMQAAINDISQRKTAEAELLKALSREKELGDLKSSFVSMVSHEFRTPLGVIQSSAEILDDYLDRLDPDERREQLQSIIRNSRRMAGLMEEVLVLGRLDAGRMHFNPAPLDLAALCRQLVDEALSTTDAQCPIEFFTSGLPGVAHADERLLRHILLNLLTNAVKYSEPGQRVSFHACGNGQTLELVVTDHGIGIPESEQTRLFEAFQRGSNVGNRHGSGLGLVIVKRCVDLHGGNIKVESKPGVGTRVTVRLPVLNPLSESERSS